MYYCIIALLHSCNINIVGKLNYYQVELKYINCNDKYYKNTN
jgi:hypothetical protein